MISPPPPPAALSLALADEAATAQLGAALSTLMRPGDVLALDGDLGAGKTALARALIRAACADPHAEVPSPTFTLVQTYDTAAGEIWHCDLYRLEHPDEALELGLEEAFAHAMVLVEWPQRLGGLLPRRAWRLSLSLAPTGGRVARLTAPGAVVDRLRSLLPPALVLSDD